ncbi:hypothetical protein DFQ05_1754 [Winogradskyella wandonensis]|uniref:Bulb-type lectin domain-containing protein n=1 Tax=Winogradskyella wandonensis TaxID=1442586 RepID=A0A4R1KTV6_9FLAO|nr:hypothetical protein [Winogradskyella wandonensis]TCK67970.1 hypothetical protein DFQ05_1754 [Winogradskyella wandonensis]
MRLTHLLFISLGFCTLSCSKLEDLSTGGVSIIAPTETTSISTFGGSLNDSAQSVVATSDGGYAILGFTQSNDGDITDKQDSSFDYWVLKFNAQDTLEWQKTYGGSEDDRGRKIIQTQDGGFAILGTSQSNDGDVSGNNGAQDYWISKLDSQGNISWQKSFGFQGNDSGISLIQTSDLGYLMTGVLDVTASGGQGNTSRSTFRHAGGDYWAVKINETGDLQWSRYFGGNFTDTAEGVAETDDGGFIIAGGSDSEDTDISNNKGTYDFWIVKINANGDLIWEKSFGGNEIDEARAIVKATDGNFVIVGDTRSSDGDVSGNNGAADLWLIKISSEGNLIWEKTLGGTSFDVARDISITRDNSFLLAGSSRSSDGDVSENKGQNDAWALKVNANGDLLWEVSVGGSNIDFAYGVTELNDQSVITVGDTSSNEGDIEENKGFTDLLIFKIN